MARAGLMSGPFAESFREASAGCSAFECWQRFVYMAAYETALSCRQDAEPIRDMAQTSRSKAEPNMDAYRNMFSEYISQIEGDPFQDFLGDAFMRLGIGNESGGQFFTPYHLARMNAAVAIGSRGVGEKGWVSVLEPACGAGANVIGFCDIMHERGIDWQRGVYFVCQDVSELTALMCYVQLSYIGAAATVIVGDTLKMERRYSLHTPVAAMDPTWTVRGMRGELCDVW